jgi:tetraacyldisaccharide 4'-kinase
MKRDLDVVLITPDDLHDRRAPFGRLRESPSALRAADAIVVDGRREDADLGAVSCPVFTLTRRLGEPQPIEPSRLTPGRQAPIVAAAGIARPERFARALEAAGWTVAASVAFADHHRFNRRDLARLEQTVTTTGAQGVLTTEKDAIRWRLLRPLPIPIAAVPLVVTVEPAAEFESWLLGRLRSLRQ